MVAYPVVLILLWVPLILLDLNLQLPWTCYQALMISGWRPKYSYISISTLIILSSVYRSYFVKSFSKKYYCDSNYSTQLANSYGVKPSEYRMLCFNILFSRYFILIKTLLNKQLTAYLYQTIILACCYFQCCIGSVFNKDSNFKCT